MRRVAIVLFGLVGGLILCAAAVVVLLPRIDLRSLVEQRASAALGRKIAMAGLHVTIGNPFVIDVEDVRIADTTSASERELGHLNHLTGELDLWPLLRGALVFRRVSINGLTITLERNTDGEGNWRRPRGEAKSTTPRTERAGFPTILDLALTNGRLTMRTSGGNLLRIDAKTIALHTTGDDRPISLAAEGAYGATPVRLDGTLESFARLRDVATPFGVAVTAKAASTTLSIRGTLTDPLRADGLSGDVQGDIEKLDTLLAITGAAIRLDIPLTLASPISRQGDMWKLPALKGNLAGAAYAGRADLTEGGRGQPDKIGLTLQLSQFDVDKFLKGTSSVAGKTSGAAAVRLEVDPNPGAVVEAQLSSKQLVWGGVQMGDLDLRLSITPSKIAVSDASLSLAGGRVTGSAEAVPAGEGAAITLHTAVAGLDVGPLLRMIGSGFRMISGRVDGRINLALTGNTLSDVLGAAHGQLALAVTNGQVARQVLQMASTDLGLLFHRESGMTPILCLLAVANVRDGIAAFSPLRMRTQDGTIVGGGSVNLRHQTLDITFQTVSETTGFFSLDIPIHVTGSLADPSVHPGLKDEMHTLAAQAAWNLRQLPPDLAPVATTNPCAR
jgi:AsmA family protein